MFLTIIGALTNLPDDYDDDNNNADDLPFIGKRILVNICYIFRDLKL